MEFHYDVAIVGAGPVGGYLALNQPPPGHGLWELSKNKEDGGPFRAAG